MAYFIAQPEALAFGKTGEHVESEGIPPDHVAARTFEVTHPTTTILSTALTPRTLGQLFATYEHEVFTKGTIWHIDSIDQWGVELGKSLATKVLPELRAADEPDRSAHDTSTVELIRRYRRLSAPEER
jgi:glucose-6-phosphate isomerase